MTLFSCSLFVFLVLVGLVSSFQTLTHSNKANLARRGRVGMMFGMGAKKVGSVTIKADGKTIIPSTVPCNLRKELMANGVDVYPLKAKITGNCGGAGICGTCSVRVLDGMSSLNPPSKNEQNTLRGKAADIRLSCCARVSGNVSVKCKTG